MNSRLNRRRFLAASGLAAANVLVLPTKRLALAAVANDRLRVAGIGVAGQGRGNLDNVAGLGAEIVALCDVDHKYAADTFKKYPQARVFKDFRRLFLLDTASPAGPCRQCPDQSPRLTARRARGGGDVADP